MFEDLVDRGSGQGEVVQANQLTLDPPSSKFALAQLQNPLAVLLEHFG